MGKGNKVRKVASLPKTKKVQPGVSPHMFATFAIRRFVAESARKAFRHIPPEDNNILNITSTRTDGLPADPESICAGLETAAVECPRLQHPLYLLFSPPDTAYCVFFGKARHRIIPSKRVKLIAGLPKLSTADAIAAGGLLCLHDAIIELWDSPHERERIVVAVCENVIHTVIETGGNLAAAQTFREDFEMSLLNKLQDSGTPVESAMMRKMLRLMAGQSPDDEDKTAITNVLPATNSLPVGNVHVVRKAADSVKRSEAEPAVGSRDASDARKIRELREECEKLAARPELSNELRELVLGPLLCPQREVNPPSAEPVLKRKEETRTNHSFLANRTYDKEDPTLSTVIGSVLPQPNSLGLDDLPLPNSFGLDDLPAPTLPPPNSLGLDDLPAPTLPPPNSFGLDDLPAPNSMPIPIIRKYGDEAPGTDQEPAQHGTDQEPAQPGRTQDLSKVKTEDIPDLVKSGVDLSVALQLTKANEKCVELQRQLELTEANAKVLELQRKLEESQRALKMSTEHSRMREGGYHWGHTLTSALRGPWRIIHLFIGFGMILPLFLVIIGAHLKAVR